MQIVFHPDFHRVYSRRDPAAERGRLEPAARALLGRYPTVTPEPAGAADLARVHEDRHLQHIRGRRKLHRMAALAAGGTLAAARLAIRGEPAFALVRPPGHHASPGSCWGFCYYNNVAVAVATLLDEGAIRSALILDIDLHFGDGTDAVFRRRPAVQYLHPEGATSQQWLDDCRDDLDRARPADLVAASAALRGAGLGLRRYWSAICARKPISAMSKEKTAGVQPMPEEQGAEAS